MSFKAKVSIDANGVKEERSVLFIQTLLLGRTKNNIDKGLLNPILMAILNCLIHQIGSMAKLPFR